MTHTAPHLDLARTTAPAIRVEGVSVRLGNRLALLDVSCDIESGSFVGLIGPNGSGKSTLIRSILGIVPLAAGRIEVEGRDIDGMRDAISFLPQRQQLEVDLPLRAWDVVMMGRLRHTGWLRAPGREDRDIVTDALERVGLVERRNSAIGEMSFGQQQRIFFARALAQQGRIVLLDEPMNGLDPKTQDLFIQLLTDFHNEGRTIIMATHDLNQAACVCDRICLLNQRLVAYGPVESVLSDEVLARAYGSHIHFMEGDEASHVHAQMLEDVHHHQDTHGYESR